MPIARCSESATTDAANHGRSLIDTNRFNASAGLKVMVQRRGTNGVFALDLSIGTPMSQAQRTGSTVSTSGAPSNPSCCNVSVPK